MIIYPIHSIQQSHIEFLSKDPFHKDHLNNLANSLFPDLKTDLDSHVMSEFRKFQVRRVFFVYCFRLEVSFFLVF